MKNSFLVSLLVTLIAPYITTSQCNDLFISEYVEGSGNNQAIEIYNPTDSVIDLSHYKYLVRQHNTVILEQNLAGTIQPKSTYVIVQGDPDSLSTPIDSILLNKADTTLPLPFRGDKYISLQDTNTWRDRVGYTESFYPKISRVYTQNNTLRRNAFINDARLYSSSLYVPKNYDFYPTQWDSVGIDNFSDLGNHTCDCPCIPFSDTLEKYFEICYNDSLYFNEKLYTDTGIFYDTLTKGCQKIAKIHISPPSNPENCPVNKLICNRIFFSEFSNGANNDVTIEIYNPTGDTVFLKDHLIQFHSFQHSFTNLIIFNTQYIKPKSTFIIVNDYQNSADAEALALADLITSINFRDRDYEEGVLLWNVLGIPFNSTLDQLDPRVFKNQTAIKTSFINSGSYPYLLEDWEELKEINYNNLGSHECQCPCIPLKDTVTQFHSFCNQSSVRINNKLYNNTGVYYDTINYGCPSILKLIIEEVDTVKVTSYKYYVHESDTIYRDTLLFEEFAYYPNNCFYNNRILEIKINQFYLADTLPLSICDSLTLSSGNKVFSNGLYTDTIYSNDPLIVDTIYVYNISTHQFYRDSVDTTYVCNQIVLPYSGQIKLVSGIYSDTLINPSNGCDSIFTSYFSIKTTYIDSIIDTVCKGFMLSNDTIFTSGVYHDTLQSIYGCDSVIYYDLFVNLYAQSLDTFILESCDTIMLNNRIIDSTGIYADTVSMGIFGCDSIFIINFKRLDTLYISQDTVSIESCDSIYYLNGNDITVAGIYFDTVDVPGCDSILVYNISFTHYVLVEVDTIKACDSTFSIISNKSITASGFYNDTLFIVGRCDSVYKAYYEISPSNNTLVYDTTCDSYTLNNGNTVDSSGTYYSINNCDTTTYHLIINYSKYTNTYISDTACSPFITHSGDILTPTSIIDHYDSIYYPLPSGCDSVSVIYRIIAPVFENNDTVEVIGNSIISKTLFAAQQWLTCDYFYQPLVGETDTVFTPQSSGNYAVEVTKFGCIDTSNCIYIQLNDSCEAFFALTQINPSEVIVIDSSYGDNIKRIWDFGDGSIDTSNNYPTHIYDTVGTYILKLSIYDSLDPYLGCSDTHSDTLSIDSNGILRNNGFSLVVLASDQVASIETVNNDNVNIYPNPTTGLITVESNTEITRYELFNSVGKNMRSSSFDSTIDISSFADGTYIFKAYTSNGCFVKRVLLSK